MKLVKENISFERGLDAKAALDVGNLRKDNIKKFIEEELFKISEPYLGRSDKERKKGVFFSDKMWFEDYNYKNAKPGVRIWTIFNGPGEIKRFKNKVIDWIERYTNFKVVKTFKHKAGVNIEFYLDEKNKVNESFNFQRGLDAKAALNVGYRLTIKKWFDWVEAVSGKNIDYTINDDLSVIVIGYLDLKDSNITEIPDNLIVNGDLNLYNCNIDELPNNLTVWGSLNLERTNISKLPDNFTVGGSLYLNHSNITELPDNLDVGGHLDIRNTRITKLPDNIHVGENLYIKGNYITELPDKLYIRGDLNLQNTNITKFPSNIKSNQIKIKDF